MKTINILKDFGIYELGSEEEVNPIVEQITIEGNTEVELDLSGCLPDYPVTSLIIDKIINEMRQVEGKKKITILIEYNLPHETLVNWLFLGSKELKIEDEKSLPLPEISNLIFDNSYKSEIEISISIKDLRTQGVIDEIKFDRRQ